MRATSLNHEVLDYSVKVQTVVEPVIYQFEEVFRGLWAVISVEFDIYRPCACRHPNYGLHVVGYDKQSNSLTLGYHGTWQYTVRQFQQPDRTVRVQ